MQDISETKKGLSGGEVLGLIIFAVSIIVILNDYVIIPRKRGTYLASCVIWNSMTINTPVADADIRQIFYDCNGERTTPSKVLQCWRITIPQTYEYATGVINKCLTAPDYPQKILFD